jgi:CRP/FNR family transcriptional regulator, cyclic AMP receptor protein
VALLYIHLRYNSSVKGEDLMATKNRADGMWTPIFDKAQQEKVERNIVDVLKDVPIFEELNRREIQSIARIAYHRSYAEGEVIVHEGEAAAGMYIIVGGEVNVTKQSEDGTIIRLATLGDGAFFGDVGLLDDSPRTATVTATRDSQMVSFFRPELLGLIDSEPKLASKIIFKLAQVLGARLRFTNNALERAQADIDNLKMALSQATQTTRETAVPESTLSTR